MVSGITQVQIQQLFKAGRYEEALALYRKATQKKIDSRDRLSIGRILLKLGRWDEADEELRRIDRTGLSSLEVLQARINLVLIRWKKGDLDEAIKRMEAIFGEEKVTLTYATLGYLYIERAIAKKDFRKALAFNLEAHEYNPQNAEIKDNYAEALLHSGDWQKALGIYEAMAAEKTPATFAEWRYHYGLALERAGRPDEALAQCRQALAKGVSALSPLSMDAVKATVERLEAKQN